MRLIKLSANQPSFHTVPFRETGVNLIIAKQKTPKSSDTHRTYNGVGKSLLIALVHFCLGSNRNNAFGQHLKKWIFTLEFTHGGQHYTVSRSTDQQDRVRLNDTPMRIGKYRTWLSETLFPYAANIKGIGLRALLSRFIRPSKYSYSSYIRIHKRDQPYTELLALSYLLGLDTNLVMQKCKLIKEQSRIKDFKEQLVEDPICKRFFTGEKDANIELQDLGEAITKHESSLANFKVAENYYEVQREANTLQRSLQRLKNRALTLENIIANIDCSLTVNPDLPIAQLQSVYDKLSLTFRAAAIRNIKSVSAFHRKLIFNRTRRLSSDRKEHSGELEKTRKRIADLGNEVNEKLRFLGSHGALDEFSKLSEHLSSLRERAKKIRSYEALLEQYTVEIENTTNKLLDGNRATRAYLKAAQRDIADTLERFRSFSRTLYPAKPGGISIKNNEGLNQLRFEVTVHIEDDASDGINEVKIFCYDATVLTMKHNHKMDFIFHDSRLFSDVDPRQRLGLFQIAQRFTARDNAQYIATINEDQVEPLKKLITDEEYGALIDDNIILSLTDDSAEEKLLGIQVDMRYEEDND